jgi:polyisoprenoid-binding protein YceI
MKRKNVFYAIVALFLLASSFTLAPATFKILSKESKVKWLGKKVTGQHNGAIDVKGGEITFDGSTLKGGTIEIDMTSITNEDLKDEGYNKKLVGHLKSDDFFGVETYPTSKFVIKSVKPVAKAAAGKPNYEVTGDLTIKASTQELTVPVWAVVEKGVARVKTTFTIDRSKFDVRYGSTSFFDNLGDKAIHNDFELDIDLVAKK